MVLELWHLSATTPASGASKNCIIVYTKAPYGAFALCTFQHVVYNGVMKRTREVHILRQLFFSPVGIFFSLLFLFVLIKANYSLYIRNDAARENRTTLQRELHTMEQRRDRLLATLGRIGTEKGEEIALREQYDVGRAGEEMVVVLDQDAPPRVDASSDTVWSRIRAFIPFF